MHLLIDCHCNLAVNPRSGIPSRAMISRVNSYRDYIFFSEFHKRGGIGAKRHIAVIPLACQLAVDINFRERHYPVEIEIHAFACVGFVERESFSVPADASPGEFAREAVFSGIKRPRYWV